MPLDATDDVLVPADLTERIATEHAAGGADLMYELLLRNPSRLNGAEGQQLWDELAALTVSSPDLVTWKEATVTVQDRGRLSTDPTGRPIRYAAAADRTAVEDELLVALRRGGPRTTPFELAGQIHVSWDGTVCAMTVDGDGPGLYALDYQGQPGVPSSVMMAGLRDGHPWSDLVAFFATVDPSTVSEPPDWVLPAGHATDEPGSGRLVTTTVERQPGAFGPVCASGAWPDLTCTAGEPGDVGG